jgi:hypothetical protein
MQTTTAIKSQSVKFCDTSNIMLKRIGSTTYRVRIHFNPNARERLDEKIRRLLKNDLQSAPSDATMNPLQVGRLS